jgi:lipid II:glycine glycyltransferase (peptidoglycan interpeptide bridge formation enzyme)
MENIKSYKVTNDLRQAPEYAKFMHSLGWKVVKINLGYVFIKRVFFLNVAKVQRFDASYGLEELEKLLKINNVLMCKLEPINGAKDFFEQRGYKQDNWPLIATKSLVYDLTPSVIEMKDSLPKDTRYTLRKRATEIKEIKINELDRFYEIWSRSAKRKKIWIPTKEEFSKMVRAFGNKCFSITVGDMAGAVVFMTNGTAYYYYAGATQEGNKRDLPYVVVWTCMLEAKRRHCKLWDFEGIFDQRWPNKDWLGFSKFKRNFGGQVVEFPGSFVKWRWPF